MSRKFAVVSVLVVLVLVTLACGSSTSGEKVGDSTSAPGATSAPVKMETFKVGDVVKVNDYTITLNSAKITGSKLMANFSIDNSSGAKEQVFSSVMSFSAKDTDGAKLDFALCDSGQLDGKVLAGDKLKGSVCWDGAKSGNKYKIYYDATLIGSGAIVWETE